VAFSLIPLLAEYLGKNTRQSNIGEENGSSAEHG